MSYSPEWEQLYATGKHLSVWPWTELVTLIMRHARPRDRQVPPRVLEIGCGAGANIPFVQSFGGLYHGIDGSATALDGIRARYGDSVVLAQGDFCEAIPFAGEFDIIIDRGSLTHNNTAAIRKGLDLVHGSLSNSGIYFGIHWFSTRCDEYQMGNETTDPYARTGFTDGAFADVGTVHFTDRPHIDDLFSKFSVQSIEHIVSSTEFPVSHDFAWWNIVAKR